VWVGDDVLCGVGGVAPLKPIVEKIAAPAITASVSARMRRGVSQPKWWVCIQVLNPVAAEAAHMTQPAHMTLQITTHRAGMGRMGSGATELIRGNWSRDCSTRSPRLRLRLLSARPSTHRLRSA